MCSGKNQHAYIYRLGIIQVLFQPRKHCHVTTSLRVGYLISFLVTHHSGAFHFLIGVLAGILELHDITQHAGNTMIDLNTRVSTVNVSTQNEHEYQKLPALEYSLAIVVRRQMLLDVCSGICIHTLTARRLPGQLIHLSDQRSNASVVNTCDGYVFL
jgi:hypothetical protein